ncbi:MAG TPA: glucosyl-3-phosphoglycerate synthase [Solirubrobacteraceae bacterium]|nr:glucosyl-3-phosphoglycerate synthase [Solirubrobacteraceae bacterium]
MRSFHHADFPADRLRSARVETVSVCVPARDEAATIAGVVEPLMGLREAGVIDQLVVLDDDSRDRTGAIARSLGAEVVRPAALLPAFGPVLGKGDAMWRSLSVLTGDLVCFVDADSEDFGAHFATGLLGPLICVEGVQFVKGFYRRPFKSADAQVQPTGGGRVTELTARPLLAAFYPELAGVRQPLAGEFAARRELLERMAFCTGYAVEMGLLLDVSADVGIDAMAQVDLDVRQNRHQPLAKLAPMSAAVLAAVTSRLRRECRLIAGAAPGDEGEPLERPPMVDLRALPDSLR